ncbi:uncharacterized protein LOC114307004 [Camellia sinensis]|uniref:uncharacterized protein LOC114307004 n=1 Tax=Camellia sinensis TaxID=4442 RepID=UPI001035D5F2|nr:uncharacterized protein LOC114307004 [Camellia sinensis]
MSLPLKMLPLLVLPLLLECPEMAYTDQCLELIDTLMLMVWRREVALISTRIEMAPPPAMRRSGGRALVRGRGGQDESGRGRNSCGKRGGRASPVDPEPEAYKRTMEKAARRVVMAKMLVLTLRFPRTVRPPVTWRLPYH